MASSADEGGPTLKDMPANTTAEPTSTPTVGRATNLGADMVNLGDEGVPT